MTSPAGAPPRLPPEVTLEGTGPRGELPPGFYGAMRHRLPLYALVGLLSLLLAVIPFNHHATAELVVAGVAFLALTALAWVLPWPAMPLWMWLGIPVGYIGVITLVRDGQGPQRAGILALYLLPVVWIALYGQRRHLLVGLAATALAMFLPLVVIGTPEYPTVMWRSSVITLVVITLVGWTILAMVGRDRSYVADLAAQSRYARESARHAVAARSQLDSLLAAATETAIMGVDRDGLLTFFSAGAEHLLGYAAADVVGVTSVYDFVDPDELAARMGEVDDLVARANADPSHPVGTASVWTFRRADGTTGRATVAVTSRPEAHGAPGFVLVASDVTQRERLAVERERLLAVQREVTHVLVEQNRRLRELTQMKDDVVATVSHELRTPLTSIRGFIELLLDDPAGLEPDQIRMLGTIDRNSAQLLRVAEDLLADPGGTRTGHGDLRDTDLAAVAGGAVDAVRAEAARQGVAVELHAAGPVVVRGEPARLNQLLDNLLANAVKYCNAGGRVRVDVEPVGTFARVAVLDDGPGIPVEDRPQLFDRFYRLASSSDQGIPGSGLGLAIAKTVAEAHEGTIDIVDTPGWSTTFRVLLPLAEPATAVPAPAPAAAVAAGGAVV